MYSSINSFLVKPKQTSLVSPQLRIIDVKYCLFYEEYGERACAKNGENEPT